MAPGAAGVDDSATYAAQRTAILYSFLGSCKMNDVEPSAWLKDVLTRLPEYKANKLH